MTLTLLTYNVYAHPYRVSERIPPLLALIQKSNADLVALQEVAPWFYRILKRQPWLTGYHVVAPLKERYVRGGMLLLSKLPVLRQRYQPLIRGIYGRGLLFAQLKTPEGPLTVATVHLTSALEQGRTRQRQLQALFRALDTEREAVVLGDFNFGDGEQPESRTLDRRYLDAWTALHPTTPGHTWDRQKSAMARRNSYLGEKSRRIDRVILRSQRWQPHRAALLGDQPLTRRRPVLFPSDHFALLVTLKPRSG